MNAPDDLSLKLALLNNPDGTPWLKGVRVECSEWHSVGSAPDRLRLTCEEVGCRGWVPGDWVAFHNAALALPGVGSIEYFTNKVRIKRPDGDWLFRTKQAPGLLGLLLALKEVGDAIRLGLS